MPVAVGTRHESWNVTQQRMGGDAPSSMRKRLQHLRAAMRRRIRYRITRGGLLFVFAAGLVAGAAVASANNLLYLILATMLSTR